MRRFLVDGILGPMAALAFPVVFTTAVFGFLYAIAFIVLCLRQMPTEVFLPCVIGGSWLIFRLKRRR